MLQRQATPAIKDALARQAAVAIIGPRQVGKTTLALEESSAVVDWYARQVLFGDKIKTPEHKTAELFKVTRDDVQRIAQHVIKDHLMNLAMIGPFTKGDEKRFAALLEQ